MCSKSGRPEVSRSVNEGEVQHAKGGSLDVAANADYVLCPKEHTDDFVKACEDA
jgi:hypothetical protein